MVISELDSARAASAILHVDMDAFYASIEEREQPSLVGRPVVVGGSPSGRGVVAAANYVARQYGVHSAMPASRARHLCPHAVFIPSRLSFYARVSRQLHEILRRYTPLIEPLALDEAFLDVTGTQRLFDAPERLAARIKREIRAELGLVASVGVAPNKFLAKLASALDKPDGLVVVDPQRVQSFLDPLPVSRLWGVGRAAQASLESMGVQTIGDLRGHARGALRARLGAWGDHLWALAHGHDERRVTPDHEAKSLSHESTFAEDVTDARTLRTWVLRLAEQVGRRLRRQGLKAGTVELKLRYGDFHTVTRSRRLAAPTDLSRELYKCAAELLAGQLHQRRSPVRLLGVGAGDLVRQGPEQQDLFDRVARARERRLDAMLDRVSARFGSSALHRGAGFEGKE